ncbi:AAA family ATPase [Nocardioides sp. AX2bis]|uniref:AAA family ATPase n=1 Tax=Nocardioides sp. AX2bis TaxID=2653157 RepID=UPI0012F17E04|nr:MoxR family ATPase [Nocardioides sp. AX2bis]VXB16726.1 carbon monoxide dehydrogenase D protein [Nocardioides sp. AX2bis]
MGPGSPAEVAARFDEHDYLADEGIATAVFLALRLGLPLLLEGEPGVGKTAAARVLAKVLDAPLVRLQCYEGLSAAEALYDWNYQRQLLAIRLAESQHESLSDADLFSEEFLVERPILQCVRHQGPNPPVLLIDEVDRADDEFEALLLESLGEASVTVPELGTFVAARPPVVVLTSNRSRELHDALRRRCLYHWLEYPDVARVAQILRRTSPASAEPLITSVAQFVGHVRSLDVDKPPGVAEAINWVAALSALGATELVRSTAVPTLGALVKTPDDRDLVLSSMTALDG